MTQKEKAFIQFIGSVERYMLSVNHPQPLFDAEDIFGLMCSWKNGTDPEMAAYVLDRCRELDQRIPFAA